MVLPRSEGPDSPVTILPITERVLHRLGRPRWLWIALWALVPLISPFVYSAAIRLAGHALDRPQFLDLVATQLVVAFACLVLLWGAGVLVKQASVLRDDLETRSHDGAPKDLFRPSESVGAPLALTILPAAVVSASGWLRYGALPPLAALPMLVVYLLPIVAYVWVYLSILAELDRLGGSPMVLDEFPQDRTLGLEKVGSLASTGLVLLLVAAVPVLVAGSDEPATLAVALTMVAVAVGLFLLSMWRLHLQMVEAKARYVAIARRLYEDAYAPIRKRADIETLESQANALRAAQSLDERAHHLMTWPIDESTIKFMAVVVTGVVTSLVVRALFGALGF